MGFHADCRAAAVQLLEDYADDASVKLQCYRARPVSLYPPTAFVDGIRDSLDHSTALTKRQPSVDVIVVHGNFDGGTAADQRDAFVDGFTDWIEARFHAAGANTMIQLDDVEDLPDWFPEWMPKNDQVTYYATRLSLGGFSAG